MAYPSTFLDLQNAVINKARLDATNDLQKVKDWLNQIYADVCVTTEALQQAATMTLTANSASYTLPTAVVRMKRVVIQPVGSVYGPPLDHVTLDEILWRRNANGASSVANGTATMYALAGLNQLELWPTPATADTMEMYYVYQPTALSGNTDTPGIQEPYASKLLEYGALSEAAAFLGNILGQNYFDQKYAIWMGKFQTHLSRRAGGNVRQLGLHGRFSGRLPHDNSIDVRWLDV